MVDAAGGGGGGGAVNVGGKCVVSALCDVGFVGGNGGDGGTFAVVVLH